MIINKATAFVLYYNLLNLHSLNSETHIYLKDSFFLDFCRIFFQMISNKEIHFSISTEFIYLFGINKFILRKDILINPLDLLDMHS